MFTAEERDQKELEKELHKLEFQIFRMRENLIDVSKDARVLGIDQSNNDDWIIVSSIDDGQTCKIMLTDCESAYRGRGCFSLIASYYDNAIHIGDIKGAEPRLWLDLHEIFKTYRQRAEYPESDGRHR